MITIADLNMMTPSETKMVREFIEDEDRRFVRNYLKRFPNWVTLAIKAPDEKERMKILDEIADMITGDVGYEIPQGTIMSELGKAMMREVK